MSFLVLVSDYLTALVGIPHALSYRGAFSKAHKLPLHRFDLGEICRDEMIAAALAGHHLKTTVHEGRGDLRRRDG